VKTGNRLETIDLLLYNAVLGQSVRIEATDPRDMVYSLVSLMDPEDAALLRPDYTASCALVYAKVTYLAMMRTQDLNVLCAIQWHHYRIPALPSWVVDYSSTTDLKVVNTIFGALDSELSKALGWKSDLPLSSCVTIDWDSLSLNITARRLDSVSHACIGIYDEHTSKREEVIRLSARFCKCVFANVPLHKGTFKLCSKPSSLIESKCASYQGFLEDQLKDWYANAESPFDFFCQILEFWNRNIGIPSKVVTSSHVGPSEHFLYRTEHYCSQEGQIVDMFATTSGLVGLAPMVFAPGDELVMLPFSGMPLILRNTGDGWSFRSLAYVHGLMDGRFIEQHIEDLPEPEQFVIH
jgi:hypothetical protein